jgi:hypothetical protein
VREDHLAPLATGCSLAHEVRERFGVHAVVPGTEAPTGGVGRHVVREPHPPGPAALMGACLDVVQAEAIGGTAYDPVGYWALLDQRSPEAVEQQIRAWLPLVAYRTLSADLTRDAAAKMDFFGAALVMPKWPSDGLGQDI